MSPNSPRIVFAGNRELARACLQRLVESDMRPVGLLVPDGKSADRVEEICALAPEALVLRGKGFRTPEGLKQLRSLQPDYLLSVHFPLLVPGEVLAVPRVGALNLHPAYLPYNRGWHTPSWSILEQTPSGATMHWMTEGLDEGDIVLQQELPVLPTDTAHGLYQRILQLELEVFEQALPLLKSNGLGREPQVGSGTAHSKADLAKVQHLDLDAPTTAREVLRRLRAHTTNRMDEALYFLDEQGNRVFVRVELTCEETGASPAST